MKNLSRIFITILLVSLLGSCTSQNKVSEGKTTQLLITENFTFIAEEANRDAQHYTVEQINSYGNSWDNPPNFRERMYFDRSTSQRLDSGYSISVSKNDLEVILPFFGESGKKGLLTESLQIQYKTADSGILKFTSNDFTIHRKVNKKGTTTLSIIAKDATNPIKIKMDVFANGKTLVVFTPGFRKSSSFGGYITMNAIAKN